MTFTDTRAEIATALSTVTGVTGYEKRPEITVLKAGDAYALLQVAERGPGAAFSATWRVIVILGADEHLALTKIDALLPDLVDALGTVAYVDSAAPLAVNTSAGDLYAVEIQARSE